MDLPIRRPCLPASLNTAKNSSLISPNRSSSLLSRLSIVFIALTFPLATACSNAATRASMSSISMALAECAKMLSAARRPVETGT
jgi:hypothetical protein